MLLDEQRQIHEDLERLEDAVAERLLEDPPHVSRATLVYRTSLTDRHRFETVSHAIMTSRGF